MAKPPKRKPGAQVANLNRASNAIATYLRRRVLLNPADRAAVQVAQAMADALVSDKGGPGQITAGETCAGRDARSAELSR